MQTWSQCRLRTAGRGRALLLLCGMLFASVSTLGGCTGPGLEPPGARGTGANAGADAGGRVPTVGGQGGKSGQDSGGGLTPGSGGSSTGSSDAGVGLIDGGKDAGMDDEDAGTLR